MAMGNVPVVEVDGDKVLGVADLVLGHGQPAEQVVHLRPVVFVRVVRDSSVMSHTGEQLCSGSDALRARVDDER